MSRTVCKKKKNLLLKEVHGPDVRAYLIANKLVYAVKRETCLLILSTTKIVLSKFVIIACGECKAILNNQL